MQIRSADGTPIAVTGTGTGPALVMIDPAGAFHGLRPMAGAISALAERFTVVTYDRRGRGDSGDTAPYSPDREVEDLAAVIGHAGGEAFVYGFSSGTALALRAAAVNAAIPKLALLEPPFGVDEPTDETLKKELRSLLDRGERGAAVEYFNRAVGVPDELVAQLRRHPAWPGLEALAHTFLYDLTLMESMSTALLNSVGQPTLVINSTGSDDYLRDTTRDVASRIPDSEHREVAGDWHGVDDDKLARLLVDWFQ